MAGKMAVTTEKTEVDSRAARLVVGSGDNLAAWWVAQTAAWWEIATVAWWAGQTAALRAASTAEKTAALRAALLAASTVVSMVGMTAGVWAALTAEMSAGRMVYQSAASKRNLKNDMGKKVNKNEKFPPFFLLYP
jgi:hypothetical protein